jgi:hypothetical protein
VAIRRALARLGFRGTYRMFGPPPPFGVEDAAADWEAVPIEEAMLRRRESAPDTELARVLEGFAPDLLVVDMFWAPLRWLVPRLRCEAWLLLRSHPPSWLVGPPDLPFDALSFTRIVAIEPISTPITTHPIDPVVMVNPEECQPRGALRRRLGMADDRRLVAVVHAGDPGEIGTLIPALQAKEELAVFDLAASGEETLFPIAGWLGDVDQLHAGGGYNAVWEATWLGFAKRTSFTPFVRRNDDQHCRLSRCKGVVMRANGADTLAGWIVRGG